MTSALGRILVVDDEPQVSAMLRDLLVEFGYVVETASPAHRSDHPGI